MEEINYNKKIKFWGNVLIVGGLSFLFMIAFARIDHYLAMAMAGILILLYCVCLISFNLGMAYHAYKLKKYFWMVLNFCSILSLHFYFSILRKKLKK